MKFHPIRKGKDDVEDLGDEVLKRVSKPPVEKNPLFMESQKYGLPINSLYCRLTTDQYDGMEYDVDIDEFSLKAPVHFSTISEWKNFNWDEKFKSTEFDVNVDINVLSTMLITKT